MTDRKQSVGIEVEARVDKSVSRAFSDVEQQTKRVARNTRELGQDTRQLAHDSRRLGNNSNQTGIRVSKLGRTFDRASNGLKKYTHNVGAAIRKNDLLRRSATKAGKSLDGIGNQWTAIAGGAVGAASITAVMDLEDRYERLGIQANKSREEMTLLRKEMFTTSQKSDVRVDQGEMLAAVEKMVEKNGDLKFAQENMANIGRVMQATGAAGMDVGEMFADMRDKFGLKNSAEVLSAIDTLVVQGKAGAFTLKHLAAEGTAVSASYSAMGRTGPKAVKEMGALLQIALMGSGSPAEAASSMDSLLSDITANYEKIEDLGISVFDEEALSRGEKKFRDIPSILKEIMEETDSDITQYSEIFGDEAMRMANILASAKGKASLDQFLAIDGDGTSVLQDSTRAAQTAKAAMTGAKNALMSAADKNLAEPIASMADSINSLDPETLNTSINVAAGVATAMGALWVGKKVVDVGIKDFVTGGKDVASIASPGAAIASMDAARGSSPGVQVVYVSNMPKVRDFSRNALEGAVQGAQQVHVTNMPKVDDFVFNGGGEADDAKHVYVTNMPKVGDFMNGSSPPSDIRPGVHSLTESISTLGEILLDESLSDADKAEKAGGSLGYLGGMAAGALAGGSIGTAFPIIGNAVGVLVGGAIGGVVGAFGGDQAGKWVGDWLSDSDKPGSAIESASSYKIPTVKEEVKTPAVTFAPVFNITGEVSDNQIKKLEKMVSDVQKKLNTQARQSDFSFSD